MRLTQKEARICKRKRALELVIEFGGDDSDLGWVEELLGLLRSGKDEQAL